MALIPKGDNQGKILVWDYEGENNSQQITWVQRWSIVNYLGPGSALFDNHYLSLPASDGDLFCAGHAWDSHGDLFVAGGTTKYDLQTGNGFEGSKLVYSYFPQHQFSYGSWIQAESTEYLQEDRWYPTVTLTGDERLLVFGGVNLAGTNAANTYEEFQMVPTGTNPPWKAQHEALLDGPDRIQNNCDNLNGYPRTHLLTNGDVIRVGYSNFSDLLEYATNLITPGTWCEVADAKYFRLNGSSVMSSIEINANGTVTENKLYILGGRTLPACDGSPAKEYLNSVEEISIDPSAPCPTSPGWVEVAPMIHKRRWLNTVLLPDGKMFVVGGLEEDPSDTTIPLNRTNEMFDGTTWTEMAVADSPRNYHSTALLLPSGKVMTAGGEHRVKDYQVYAPHYLCGCDPQPVVTNPPGTLEMQYGVTYTNEFTIASGGLDRVVIMRPGSVTHHNDYDQRLVELPSTIYFDSVTSTWKVDFMVPNNANIAPKGYYMLFLLSDKDVPSEAFWVNLQS